MKTAVQSLMRSLNPKVQAALRDVDRTSRSLGDAHHWVFDHFAPFEGDVTGEFALSFIGAKTRPEFGASMSLPAAGPVRSAIPAKTEEYFQWIDLLESVRAAGERFTYLELGAGYGRWSVSAALACRQLGKSFRLGLAEAMPKHIAFLHQHMLDNDIPPDAYRVYAGAVEDKDAPVTFCVYYPSGGTHWYGQSTMTWELGENAVEIGSFNGLPLYEEENGMHLVKMDAVRLSTILEDYDLVDLADFDIQGSEARVIAEALPALCRKVRRMHIETHNEQVEVEIRRSLSEAGWICLRDYSLEKTHQTPFGTIEFVGGIQSWLNPRLT